MEVNADTAAFLVERQRIIFTSTMKAHHLLGLFLLFGMAAPTHVLAQKCKYSYDEKDPMSGNTIRRTTVKLQGSFILHFYRNGDDHRVELNVRMAGERNFMVAEGNELQIKLADGRILSVPAAQAASPVSYVNAGQVMTNYAISHRCSKEDLGAIAASGVTVLRVQLGDETITYEVKAKDTEESKEKAACLLVE